MAVSDHFGYDYLVVDEGYLSHIDVDFDSYGAIHKVDDEYTVTIDDETIASVETDRKYKIVRSSDSRSGFTLLGKKKGFTNVTVHSKSNPELSLTKQIVVI